MTMQDIICALSQSGSLCRHEFDDKFEKCDCHKENHHQDHWERKECDHDECRIHDCGCETKFLGKSIEECEYYSVCRRKFIEPCHKEHKCCPCNAWEKKEREHECRCEEKREEKHECKCKCKCD